MSIRKCFGAIAASVVVGSMGSAFAADIIGFDPLGTSGANGVQVGSFDFLPGNSLYQVGQTENTGTLYIHTRLGSLLDNNGSVIATPGLNESNGYEITFVAAIPVSVLNTTINAFTEQALISLDIGRASVQMLFDDSPDAVDLTGLGFYDGTVIFQSGVTSFDASAVTFAFLGKFDQFGTDNYAGIFSPMLAGGGLMITDVPSVDNAFFLDGSNIQSLLVNSNLAAPFTQANPSAVFADGAVIPSFGIINGGTEGPSDFQIQNDGTGSFIVIPEPTSIALMAVAGLALIRRRIA